VTEYSQHDAATLGRKTRGKGRASHPSSGRRGGAIGVRATQKKNGGEQSPTEVGDEASVLPASWRETLVDAVKNRAREK